MNRYSFSTEDEALDLVSGLGLLVGQTASKDIHGIMVWGFEDKVIPILDELEQPTFDADGLPLVDIIKGTTYNVDIVWKAEQPTEWEQYEVFPNTPNHRLS
jgi:hypothetical protein